MVSGLTHTYNSHDPNAHIRPEKTKVSASDNSPFAVGRHAVRFMTASIFFSTMQLKAAAAPATNQMPTHDHRPNCTSSQVGTPGTASTMPIKAQKTISWMTRGLVSALNWRKRVMREKLSFIQFSVYALRTATTP